MINFIFQHIIFVTTHTFSVPHKQNLLKSLVFSVCVCFPLIWPQTLPQLSEFPLKLLRLKQFHPSEDNPPESLPGFTRDCLRFTLFTAVILRSFFTRNLCLSNLLYASLFLCCCYCMILRWHPNTGYTWNFLVGQRRQSWILFFLSIWNTRLHQLLISNIAIKKSEV